MKVTKRFESRQPVLIFIWLIVMVLFLTACGTTEPETFTIGIVNLSAALDQSVAGFKEGLAELGYVEGENLTILYDGLLPDMAAAELNVDIIVDEVQTPDEVMAAIAAIPEEADGIFVMPSFLILNHIPNLVEAALEQDLPLSSLAQSHVEAGVLMVYGLEFYAVGKQAARLADQILKSEGTSAGDFPMETPEFFLAVNVKTAAAIGITIPDDALEAAVTIVR